METNDRLFIGTYPTGIVYADRKNEVRGDYKRLAFLPYASLLLQFEPRVDHDLRLQIVTHAASIQARRGQQYEIDCCGHTVLLGRGAP